MLLKAVSNFKSGHLLLQPVSQVMVEDLPTHKGQGERFTLLVSSSSALHPS